MKKIGIFLMASMLLLSILPGGTARADVYQLGDSIGNITFTAYDGQSFTLQDLLNEKDMVLLNLWASWCGPCENEFPALEAAYEAYQDHVAVVALSVEPTDTDAVIAQYAAAHGLTFPMGRDEAGLSSAFAQPGIPVSVVVDRFGVICLIECGAVTDSVRFTRLFDAFVGDDYTASVLLNDFPAELPTAEAEDPAALAAALGAEAVINPEDKSVWPMVLAEADGRTVIAASNTATAQASHAQVTCRLAAAPGDAVAVTFKLKARQGLNALTLSLNGERIKRFSGELGWTTYLIPVTQAGECLLTLSFDRLSGGDQGEYAYVAAVTLLTGDEAAAALAGQIAYPVADAISFTPVSPLARRITCTAPAAVEMYFGPCDMYIVPDDAPEFDVTITAAIDPDAACFYNLYDGAITLLRDAADGDHYALSTETQAMVPQGYPTTCTLLYPFGDEEPLAGVMTFADEDTADLFFGVLLSNTFGTDVTWAYAQEEAPAPAASGEVRYLIRYLDQAGDPVPGVTCQVCSEEICTFHQSDENGAIELFLAPGAWEIHTLKIPEGYSGDTSSDTIASPEGGEYLFTLTKTD